MAGRGLCLFVHALFQPASMLATSAMSVQQLYLCQIPREMHHPGVNPWVLQPISCWQRRATRSCSSHTSSARRLRRRTSPQCGPGSACRLEPCSTPRYCPLPDWTYIQLAHCLGGVCTVNCDIEWKPAKARNGQWQCPLYMLLKDDSAYARVLGVTAKVVS